MPKAKPEDDQHEVDHPALELASDDHHEDFDDDISSKEGSLVATVATVGVVGVGVAVLEAALLPGLVLGVAAMAAPKLVPRLGSALGPLLRSTVRGVYLASQKTREIVAEAQEHVQDIVAEVDAEQKIDLDVDEACRGAMNEASPRTGGASPTFDEMHSSVAQDGIEPKPKKPKEAEAHARNRPPHARAGSHKESFRKGKSRASAADR